MPGKYSESFLLQQFRLKDGKEFSLNRAVFIQFDCRIKTGVIIAMDRVKGLGLSTPEPVLLTIVPRDCIYKLLVRSFPVLGGDLFSQVVLPAGRFTIEKSMVI